MGYGQMAQSLRARLGSDGKRGMAKCFELFRQCRSGKKSEDKGKTRAYGAVFIEYFPNREMGICYYHLGEMPRAREFLILSLQQSASERAREFLSRIQRGPAAAVEPVATLPKASNQPKARPATPAPSAPTTLVGERLSIAILPFATKGVGREIGEIDLLDKLKTVFVNLNRFKVIERALLEKILAEQKLGISGVIDEATAAQIGKGIGVDAVVCGSIAHAGNSASIDARLVDTETAAIITAQDAFANWLSLPNLSQMISEVAGKIRNDLPCAKPAESNRGLWRRGFSVGAGYFQKFL